MPRALHSQQRPRTAGQPCAVNVRQPPCAGDDRSQVLKSSFWIANRERYIRGITMDSARHTLQKLIAGILNGFPAEQVPVEAWPFVCGKQVAERTRAVGFADGVLRVEVRDAGWRTELRALSGGYLATLNQYSATRVARIEFVLGEEAAGAAPPGVGKARAARSAAKPPRRTGKWQTQK